MVCSSRRNDKSKGTRMIDVSGWRKRQIMAEDDDDIQDYKKPWVGLTDEEIEEGHKDSWVTKQAFESAVWWAEKILKEKNT
jgi:hypothetical protein